MATAIWLLAPLPSLHYNAGTTRPAQTRASAAETHVMDDPINALPDGIYPFANERLPLDELAMREAPRELEDLLKAAAVRNGTAIVRDIPVELTCEAAGFPDATFLVFWPTGEERIHILAPKTSVIGRA